jgi:hypothetical protein
MIGKATLRPTGWTRNRFQGARDAGITFAPDPAHDRGTVDDRRLCANSKHRGRADGVRRMSRSDQ